MDGNDASPVRPEHHGGDDVVTTLHGGDVVVTTPHGGDDVVTTPYGGTDGGDDAATTPDGAMMAVMMLLGPVAEHTRPGDLASMEVATAMAPVVARTRHTTTRITPQRARARQRWGRSDARMGSHRQVVAKLTRGEKC